MTDSGRKNSKNQTIGHATDHVLCKDENPPDDQITEGQEATPYVRT